MAHIITACVPDTRLTEPPVLLRNPTLQWFLITLRAKPKLLQGRANTRLPHLFQAPATHTLIIPGRRYALVPAPAQEGDFALDVPFAWNIPPQVSAQTPLPQGHFVDLGDDVFSVFLLHYTVSSRRQEPPLFLSSASTLLDAGGHPSIQSNGCSRYIII